MNFCSRFLRLSVVPRCRERPQIAMCFLEWLGRLKWRATGLDASLSFFSTSRRCSRNRSPSRLPVSPMYNLLHNVQVMQEMTFAEVHVKRSVILTDRLGPDILLVLTMKRQVLHRERAYLKVPGCSLVLSALLTKKLPTFFEKRGYPVSVVKAGHHRAQQFDRQSSLQTSQKDKNDRIPFTLTFHPHNHAVKSIILSNFKLLQNDPETGRIFSQPPLISFKRDKNVGTCRKAQLV